MCLAIPARIVELTGEDNARVDLGGVLHIAGELGDGPIRELLGELVAGLAEPAFVPVADQHVAAFEQDAPRRREADAGAGGGGDHGLASGEQSVAGGFGRRGGQGRAERREMLPALTFLIAARTGPPAGR